MRKKIFQSTRPSRGATRLRKPPRRLLHISIHAPLAGRDSLVLITIGPFLHFNPRAPRGARLSKPKFSVIGLLFQSTRPSRGATVILRIPPRGFSIFQSTRPSRGATTMISSLTLKILNFNPRAPRGARPTGRGRTRWATTISIHAPLAGRDYLLGRTDDPQSHRFQSTRPSRGATRLENKRQTIGLIFQSTRPSRGATMEGEIPEGGYPISIHAPLAGRD